MLLCDRKCRIWLQQFVVGDFDANAFHTFFHAGADHTPWSFKGCCHFATVTHLARYESLLTYILQSFLRKDEIGSLKLREPAFHAIMQNCLNNIMHALTIANFPTIELVSCYQPFLEVSMTSFIQPTIYFSGHTAYFNRSFQSPSQEFALNEEFGYPAFSHLPLMYGSSEHVHGQSNPVIWRHLPNWCLSARYERPF